jgi:nucleoside-diphosphate-sugar epimerase
VLAVFSLADIALRQGTVSGYSPRMRFDLIVNTMYKNAIVNGKLTVNNPSIWRPIIDVRDTSTAFLRAVQAKLCDQRFLQRRL